MRLHMYFSYQTSEFPYTAVVDNVPVSLLSSAAASERPVHIAQAFFSLRRGWLTVPCTVHGQNRKTTSQKTGHSVSVASEIVEREAFQASRLCPVKSVFVSLELLPTRLPFA